MNWIYLLLKRGILLIWFCEFMICLSAQETENNYATPSHLGMTGLVFTPSAYMPEWGMLDFGFTHFPKEAALTFEAGRSPERTILSSFTFLPFLELSLRTTKPYANVKNEHYGIGDRSISIRVQLFKERKKLPAIVLGIQDPFAIQSFFNTNYLVFTKKYALKKIEIVANLGYGISFEEETKGDYLQGAFGGLQMYWKKINLLAEYDTKHLNIGAGYQFRKMLFLKAALVNGRYFSGSVNLRFFIR